MFTDSPELRPPRQLLIPCATWATLLPGLGLIVRGGRCWGVTTGASYHPDQGQTAQPNRIVTDGHGGIVGRRTGECDHSRLLSKAAGIIACCLEALAGINEETQ